MIVCDSCMARGLTIPAYEVTVPLKQGRHMCEKCQANLTNAVHALMTVMAENGVDPMTLLVAYDAMLMQYSQAILHKQLVVDAELMQYVANATAARNPANGVYKLFQPPEA